MLMNDILTSFQMNLFEQEYFREKEHVNKEFEVGGFKSEAI